jgi:hypothetical protein
MTYIPHNAERERQQKHYAAVKARLYAGAIRPVPLVLLPPKPVKRDWLHLASPGSRPSWPPCRLDDKTPKLEDVLQAVCRVWGFSRVALVSARRGTVMVEARHVYYWSAHAYTGASYPQIATHCGGRDHTTAINGVRRVEARLLHFAPMIEKVKAELGITELTVGATYRHVDMTDNPANRRIETGAIEGQGA